MFAKDLFGREIAMQQEQNIYVVKNARIHILEKETKIKIEAQKVFHIKVLEIMMKI